jgi:hypothetical protein
MPILPADRFGWLPGLISARISAHEIAVNAGELADFVLVASLLQFLCSFFLHRLTEGRSTAPSFQKQAIIVTLQVLHADS